MNQHEKDRKDEGKGEPVRPPIDGDENMPDGAVHRVPEHERDQERRPPDERERQEEETSN